MQFKIAIFIFLFLTTFLYSKNNITEITIIALYSEDSKYRYLIFNPAKEIKKSIKNTNQVNINSGVKIKYKLVYLKEYPLNTSLNNYDFMSTYLKDKNIKQLRNKYKADLVLLYKPTKKNDKMKGLGYINSELQENLAYAFISINGAKYATAHEIGHLLGLGHSYRSEPLGDEYPYKRYGKGYGINNKFSTIMSYTKEFETKKRIPIYSNPEIKYKNHPCGIKKIANSTKALNEARFKVSKFR